MLDKSNSRPLFKLEFDKSSLKGDFYIDDPYLTKTSIGYLKMKAEDSDKY